MADVLRIVGVQDSGQNGVIGIAVQLMHRPQNARTGIGAVR